MNPVLAQALRQIGDFSTPATVRPVAGGDINEAFFVETENHRYFIKMNRTADRDFFAYEAAGLEILRATETVAVPEVYDYGMIDNTAVLVLEWIEGRKSATTETELGHALAHMHQHYGEAFGLDYDNYIGTMMQPNGQSETWLPFFRDKRLGWQASVAEEKGLLNVKRRKRIDCLFSRLGQWLPEKIRPSTLHGDLWGGNWLVGPGGHPYLMDPAVFYGHFEFELAFTELFGGYSSQFYEAYRQVQTIPSDYEERRPLYQLFYLLVHLNSFGEAYGPSVDRILKRYGG